MIVGRFGSRVVRDPVLSPSREEREEVDGKKSKVSVSDASVECRSTTLMALALERCVLSIVVRGNAEARVSGRHKRTDQGMKYTQMAPSAYAPPSAVFGHAPEDGAVVV